tara:strand:+ start:106 stop:522 length:417 start_codon:yes stop_codon:yes gene_type:complete
MGLAYGAHMWNSTISKTLTFKLGRATDPVKARDAAAQIVNDFSAGKLKITDIDLESTKSSLVYALVGAQATKNEAAAGAKYNLFGGKDASYNKKLIDKVLKVTKEEALAALSKFLVPLFGGSAGEREKRNTARMRGLL